MSTDAQGQELTNATAETARHIDEATRAFILAYGDANAHLAAAREAAPDCVMAHLAQAWIQALSNDPATIVLARKSLAGSADLAMNAREGTHRAALAAAVDGDWAAASGILDRHLLSHPFDILAHQVVMRLDGFQGRFHWVADRTARALPFWSKSQPGYGLLLSFYGFGLEEAGDYRRAEDISRASAELEPHGYWPHHAVSHVLEMTGRPAEGVAWMESRAPLWSAPGNANRVHIWWHKTLFHVELGQFDEALAIYDDAILATLRPVGTSLCNGTALLWRLETLGCDAGERWQHLMPLWKERASGSSSPFNDIHYAMTALRAGQPEALEPLLVAMRQTASRRDGMGAAYRDLAVPVVEAMAAFDQRDYAATLERLLPVRFDLWRMGGSKAQRDLVDWTLTEAALRSGNREMALSLANERLALRPGSVPNQRFHARAEGLVA